jgi:hypothetical protein
MQIASAFLAVKCHVNNQGFAELLRGRIQYNAVQS